MTTSAIGSAIDVGSIVSQLMAVERQPLTALQKSISGIQTKLSAFGKVQGQLSTFQDAAKELFALDTWRSAQATSSDETAAKATASTGAIPGSYDLTVTQLAQRQTLSTGALASGDVVVGGGAMRVQLGTYASVGNTFTANPDKPEVSITIAAGSTLSQVRDAINSAANRPDCRTSRGSPSPTTTATAPTPPDCPRSPTTRRWPPARART